MTLKIAITGGIGSGKSTFSKEVIRRNIKLIDSDVQVSSLYNKPTNNFLRYLKKIGLGPSIYKNKVNKKIIASIIFSDKNVRLKLESYIFKIIRKQRDSAIKKEKKKKSKTVFFDIPLLFENRIEKEFDLVIAIISKREERFKRLRLSRKISKQKFEKILRLQTSDVVRRNKSDIVIYNNSSLRNYVFKINKIIDRICI